VARLQRARLYKVLADAEFVSLSTDKNNIRNNALLYLETWEGFPYIYRDKPIDSIDFHG